MLKKIVPNSSFWGEGGGGWLQIVNEDRAQAFWRETETRFPQILRSCWRWAEPSEILAQKRPIFALVAAVLVNWRIFLGILTRIARAILAKISVKLCQFPKIANDQCERGICGSGIFAGIGLQAANLIWEPPLIPTNNVTIWTNFAPSGAKALHLVHGEGHYKSFKRPWKFCLSRAEA